MKITWIFAISLSPRIISMLLLCGTSLFLYIINWSCAHFLCRLEQAGMSRAHLDEWQRRSFDISSGSCTPEQTADAYRAHVLSIQYAWASAELSPAGAASLLRTYSERYAAVLDSDEPRTGLNNYAESALHLARNQKNHSDKWESSLTFETVFTCRACNGWCRPGQKEGALLVDPADVNITVGGEVSMGDEKGSALSLLLLLD